MEKIKPHLLITFLFAFVTFTAVDMSAQNFSRATKTKNASCPSGSFFDLIDGGTCWTCPKGYKRTVFAVNSSQACERSSTTNFVAANDRGKGTGFLGTDCPRGAFFDPNGRCYSCPSGYKRTVYSVKGSKACEKSIAASFSRATKVSSLSCGNGSFFDPIDGGSCWSCPKGTQRTVYAVNSGKACETPQKYKSENLSASEKSQLKAITQKFSNKNSRLVSSVEGMHSFLNNKASRSYFMNGSFKTDLDNGNYSTIWRRIEPQLRPFVSAIKEIGRRNGGELAKFRALTISVSGGGGFVVGASATDGLIIILNPDNTVKLQGFSEFGGTVGTNIGIYSAVAVGLYKVGPDIHNSNQNSLDCGAGFSIGMGFSVGPVGVGGGIAIDPYLVCGNRWAELITLEAIDGIYIEGSISVSPKWAIPVDVNAAFSSSIVFESNGRRLVSKCSDCGKQGQRPCSILESFPSCKNGLKERCDTCER